MSKSSLLESTDWDKLAVSALACEMAAIHGNWTEFSQLCDFRSAELQTIATEGKQPPEGVVDVILGADGRTRERLEKRMKVVASELRKYAKFRDMKKRYGA